MHREFRELLDKAQGRSELAVVANVDIRGFSAFSLEVDSAAVAVYIRRVYAAIIDNYLPSEAYFKPTGDGLLVVVSHAPGDLHAAAEATVVSFLRLTAEFPGLCSGDPIINFPTPDKVGVGIARGTVSRLESDGKILDYSGRTLNLAARLMDLARPSGVVLDGTFGQAGVLTSGTMKKFEIASAFMEGIAPLKPVSVYCMRGVNAIPPEHQRPLGGDWKTHHIATSLRELRRFGERGFDYQLPEHPFDKKTVTASMEVPARGLSKLGTLWRVTGEVKYREEAGAPYVAISFAKSLKRLRDEGVTLDRKLRVEVRYF